MPKASLSRLETMSFKFGDNFFSGSILPIYFIFLNKSIRLCYTYISKTYNFQLLIIFSIPQFVKRGKNYVFVQMTNIFKKVIFLN